METGRRVEDLEVAILCGGKGTRLLSAVSDRPKALAEVAGRPFLDHLIDYLSSFGLRRFILCTGHLGDMIEAHYRRPGNDDREIVFSQEGKTLGTGGAVKLALSRCCRGDELLVVNGDTFCRIDVQAFAKFHALHDGVASIVVTPTGPGVDQGAISLDSLGRIATFSEKPREGGEGYTNAGIYLFRRQLLEFLPQEEAFSLEYDVFPRLADAGACHGFLTGSPFLDIGTPERYWRAHHEEF